MVAMVTNDIVTARNKEIKMSLSDKKSPAIMECYISIKYEKALILIETIFSHLHEKSHH